MSLTVTGISAFSDNYIWCIRDDSRRAFIVDPGDAAPVKEYLAENALTLSGIVVTHHHPDHVDGIADLVATFGCDVYANSNGTYRDFTRGVSEGDRVDILGTSFSVITVPGHTLDHIAYYSDAHQGMLFCGDTLFAGGCGRVFEGTFPMMRASLEKLRLLPDSTWVFCAHEYTQSNLKFAVAADPSNASLAERVQKCAALRLNSMPTVPSTIGIERETNPFLRWDAPSLIDNLETRGLTDRSGDAVFESLRSWKDSF